MILLDTSVWIAFLDRDDSCHQQALEILVNLNYKDVEVIDHLYAETLTVFRNKGSDQYSINFMAFLTDEEIKVINTSNNAFGLAQELFFSFRKLSFNDSLLMAVAKELNAQLVTFDKELSKAWVEVNKWKDLPEEN
ncbi:MAG: PIN domain-containing protein [Patescibacteria group bacterium]